MSKFPLLEKASLKPNGEKVLGIQLKCPKHDWQRTIYIKNGIGCSYCYGNKPVDNPTNQKDITGVV